MAGRLHKQRCGARSTGSDTSKAHTNVSIQKKYADSPAGPHILTTQHHLAALPLLLVCLAVGGAAAAAVGLQAVLQVLWGVLHVLWGVPTWAVVAAGAGAAAVGQALLPELLVLGNPLQLPPLGQPLLGPSAAAT